MKLLFVTMIVITVGIAVAGIACLLPKKGRKTSTPQPELISPESMVKVTPAGPGRLRMSIPQGDRMPMEVMLQVAEVREETDLDRLKDTALSPEEKQEVVNRLRSMGYEISYDPLQKADEAAPPPNNATENGAKMDSRKKVEEFDLFEPVTVVEFESGAPDDMTSE